MNTRQRGAREFDARLRIAASGDNWSSVIHRCAWCHHLLDESGARTNVVAMDSSAIATDGMCAACGATALARLSQRRTRLQAA